MDDQTRITILFKEYDSLRERMRSRLHEMCKKVEIEGLDFREHSKQAQFGRHDALSHVTPRSKSKPSTTD